MTQPQTSPAGTGVAPAAFLERVTGAESLLCPLSAPS
jgi:hypothetical protein